MIANEIFIRYERLSKGTCLFRTKINKALKNNNKLFLEMLFEFLIIIIGFC